MFCITVVFGQDLVYSKHRNTERIGGSIKSPLLSHLGRNVTFLKNILSDLGCSENFQKTHRKNRIDFTSASKKRISAQVISCEFSKHFSEHPLSQNFGIIYKFGKIIDNCSIVMRSNAINRRPGLSFHLQCYKG